MRDLIAAQQRADDDDRLAQRGQRLGVAEAHPLDGKADARADAEPDPAAGELVERADLHRDQARMPAVRIEHAGADPKRRGRDRAGRGCRHRAAVKRVLGKPDGVDAGGLRGVRLLDAALRRQPAVQPDAQPRQQPLRSYTPPGRGPESAGEKCACTTRHCPSSLRNTMVEREMNSLLS